MHTFIVYLNIEVVFFLLYKFYLQLQITKSRMLMVSTMLPCIQTPSNFKFQYFFGVLVDSLALDRSICCNPHESNNMGAQRNQMQAPKLQMTPLQNFNIDVRILETLVVIEMNLFLVPKVEEVLN